MDTDDRAEEHMSSQEEEKRRPDFHSFICPWCESPAYAQERGAAVWDGFRKNIPVNPPVEYKLVQCSECGDVSLEVREDFGAGFEADQVSFAYPARRRLSRDVPGPLRNEFNEAQKCFSVKAYGATVVMVRRILEGVCTENGVPARTTLARGLQQLRDNGLIDDTISEWATILRMVGNEGAHYTGQSVPRADAEDAIAFAEALLDNIYVLRIRFTEFKNRRAGNSSSKPTPSK